MKKLLQAFVLPLIIFASAYPQGIPPTPANVVAQGFSNEHPRVVVSWQVAPGPWDFNLYRSMNDSIHFTRIGQCDERSFEDNGVVAGRTYYYYVKSVVWNDSALVESGRSNIAVASLGSSTAIRGTIQGTVADDTTGVPIPSVRVRFYRQGHNWADVYDITDSLGRYEAVMDTGRYLIQAEPPSGPNSWQSYRDQWYVDAPDPSTATSVPVSNGSVFTANFGLHHFSALHNSLISGVVQNEQGQPLSNATVAIMRSIQDMNHICATTGTIPGLGAEARTLNGIGYTRGVVWSGVTDGQGRFQAMVMAHESYIAAAGKSGFLMQYFDHTGDPTEATMIGAADDTSGVNFRLIASTAAPGTIRGVVRDSTGITVPSRVILFPRPPHGQQSTQVAHTANDGTYQFSHVDAGAYIVLAVPYSNYAVGFYKEGQYGVSQWQQADSIVVGITTAGADIGVVPIQSNGLTRLSGMSSSSTGEPLVGGRIVVKNSLGAVVGNGVSTAAGTYFVDALPVGDVTLVVDREPYSPALVNLNIPLNTYTLNNVNFVLTRTAPTAVNANNPAVHVFALEQNYPNPFNPETKISYSLPQDGRVSLIVFDILGREIATLVNEDQQAGEHSLGFNASKLASGIYYYRLNAAGLMDVKKMLLLK